MSKTILFIHDAWLSPDCWQGWRARYEAAGHACIAPAWPYGDRTVDELRRSPDPRLASLTIGEVVHHYARIISDLPTPPILIGHSFGGLFVQILLDRGFGAAGVGIDAVPPRGVMPGLSSLGAALPVLLAWRGWRRILTMSPSNFSATFAQTLPLAEAAAAHQRYVVPTPGKIHFEAVLGIGTAVDYGNPRRAPLLLVAGEEDRTVEPSMVRAAYERHLRSPAETAFRMFPRRSHWLIAEPGWDAVADYCLAWADTRTTDL